MDASTLCAIGGAVNRHFPASTRFRPTCRAAPFLPVYHPEKALDAETAYKIFSKWMNGGESANKKTVSDYTKARAMVNGSDHASDIAKLAQTFEAILQASLRKP